MQAKTQISGQSSGQTTCQITGVSNANSLPMSGGSHRTWQSDSDVAIRRNIVEKILHLFQKRKPRVSQEWQQKLPEFVKRLEESLYRDASSKEEYSDLSTLENRLFAVAKRIMPARNMASNVANAPASSMIPTPGATMIPIPGNEAVVVSSTGLGTVKLNPNNVSPNVSSMLQRQGMGTAGTMTSMVPTPGLGCNTLTSTEPSTSSTGNSPAAPVQGGAQTQRQSYGPGASGHLLSNMNSQLGPNIQRKNPMSFGYVNGGTSNNVQLMGSGQHLMNGNIAFPNPSMYMNSVQYGNVQLQRQQHATQQRQQHMPMQFTNVPSNSAAMHPPVMQASTMIPVPGMPPQHMNPQSHLQQSLSQPEKKTHSISPSKLAGPARDQQQQDQVAAKVSYQAQSPSNTPARKLMSEESQVGMGLLPASNASIQTIGIGQQHQQLSNNHYKHVNNPTKEYPSQISSDQDHAMMKPVHEQQTQKQPDMHLIHPLQEDKLPYIQQQTSNSHAQAPQNLQRHQPVVQHSSQMLQQRPQQQILHPGYGESSQRSLQISDNGGALPGHPGSVQVPTVGRSMNMDGQRAQQYLKQQRWLLFLRHASKCTAPEGQCQTTPHCLIARELWSHITKCTDRDCQYPRCQPSRTLIRHHQNCRDPQCPVCAPVRQKLGMQRMQPAQANSSLSVGPNTVVRTSAVCAEGNTEASLNKVSSPAVGPADDQTPPAKRPKLEQIETVKAAADDAVTDPKDHQVEPHLISVKVEENVSESVKVEGAQNIFVPPAGNRIKSEEDNKMKLKGEDQKKYEETNNTEVERTVKREKSGATTAESSLAASNKLTTPAKQEVKQEIVSSPASDPGTIAKCSKPKIKGVSLTELFTPEQIREHIYSLRQWVGQSKAKVEKNQAMESRMTENSCQLCAVETLTFEPPPIYCTLCGARVKRNAFYWTMQIGDTRHYFCVPCYNDSRTENVEIDGAIFPKSRLEKRRNDEETEEPWVQCDKCEKWQHQVCALFNMRRNEGGQAEYTCPHCLIIEVEKGERKPLPQSAVLGAKDLPRTLLSDHIEQRLSRKLKQERMDRARSEGKNYEEVPGAESLVIRIVSSVDKKLDVKQRFLEMFQEEDYPTEFPYKSKVLLLFQRIEGVEVCLFGMYVQEFGSDAAQPNQRRVYLSYLDSVKYFRPDVKTNNGEALRTFVYHEILIGYLDYCKKRGFTSCYIWACPPLKGEDYILYCHPEIQKTPKSDKLREWYLTMLRKAASEGIVAELTNMYDHFFIRSGESKAKVTAARLPYFEGDYWPGAAEDTIMQLQEEEGGLRQQKKGKTKKTITKRATKTAAQAELANNASKDLQLMHKLGETIFPMKEDFIMVHLQLACSHCCNFIISGQRWACKQCKNFNLCDRCHDAEHALDDRDRHPLISKEAHLLFPVELGEPLGDTKDKDEITESEFFDTRQAFLSLCQGNHYQYDTLRRAKHSSMMVLYHLHNPTAPAFVTTCNMCSRDIETGQGWRCETCPDFDVCNSCYSKSDSVKHPHKLSPHPSATERTAQNKEARQQRVVQLRKMLDLLVHASQCGSPVCQYPTCRKVKGLFRHGMSCKVRASGGCHLCKKMWYLLQLHARACKESECRVPRCKDLKEHLRRLQQQMESRRRAAVNEMMRQRAAEAAAGSS
ncbi:hypothetical protein KP509_25G022700 [Ceratopteris richardii]|uniref:histone acetyltransferase n=1 Tax=Ceratopteris richardii TaxID=49495 RepID=A0A8T2RPI3_CERRI|nr:hypothetical protein KP509_25G022700 [Ceratopteris richardii]KAH7298001.1 hypothetical protein KP509_25G022700 [Ceratopteris richardii]